MEDITKIVERIENNNSIDAVNLSGRDIKILPPFLCELTHIKFLYLSNNKLIFIPEIGKLVKLEELSLEKNEITLIPESFFNLKALKVLTLNNNPLKILNLNLFLNLRNLTILWLNFCEIMYLPDEIGLIDKLERLGLKGNNLQELPNTIGQLENLKWLNIEKNQILLLPDSIKNMKMLGYLNISHNKVEKIPKFLFEMKSLVTLLARSNFIKKIEDDDIIGLSFLQKVDLRDNPFITSAQFNGSDFYRQLLCLQIFVLEN
jgi:Leucine-rich repeat (LRR) protein